MVRDENGSSWSESGTGVGSPCGQLFVGAVSGEVDVHHVLRPSARSKTGYGDNQKERGGNRFMLRVHRGSDGNRVVKVES